MGKTSIEWTDFTFNSWIGCSHAKLADGTEHPACANCYAEVGAQARIQRSRGLPLWGEQAHRHHTSDDYWKQPAAWNRAAEKAGERARVFCASNADVFEDRRDLDPARARLARVVADTPWLDWLFLTKRPDRAGELWEQAWAEGTTGHPRREDGPWLPSIWLGTSISDQPTAEELVPQLLGVPAAVRFLSAEPLLGPIDLDLPRCDDHGRDEVQRDEATGEEFCNECAASGYSGELSFNHWLDACADSNQPGINWVIVGGESGPGARPFDLAWARDIAEQCHAAGVPYFWKQAGARPWLHRMPVRVSGKGGNAAEILRATADVGFPSSALRREWPEVWNA